ncbi:MAG: universal stress protein [Solibacillus sp.]
MYKHILVAVDGSDNSLRAVQDAVNVAKEQSLVELLFVGSTEAIASDVFKAGTLDNLHESYKAQFTREIIAVKQHPNTKITIENGEAGKTITKYANSNAVDLVVLGCRGLTAMQEMVFGSVSTYVLKNVNCSTLVVK